MSTERQPRTTSGEPRSKRPYRPREKGERRGKYFPRRRVCAFCVEKIKSIDYKDVNRLSRYLSDRGKIEPRRRSGTCARHQRVLSQALKRARHIALLPYTGIHLRERATTP